MCSETQSRQNCASNKTSAVQPAYHQLKFAVIAVLDLDLDAASIIEYTASRLIVYTCMQNASCHLHAVVSCLAVCRQGIQLLVVGLCCSCCLGF